MVEENATDTSVNIDSEPAKTVTDVEIDNLKKQIAILTDKVNEYQDANRKLYAHAVGIANDDVATIEEPSFNYDKAAIAFYKALGIEIPKE